MTTSATATANLRPAVQPAATMQTDNLRAALAIACNELRRREAQLSPSYCSAMRAGFEANLVALRNGMRLTIEA